jgi:hypothetical protein
VISEKPFPFGSKKFGTLKKSTPKPDKTGRREFPVSSEHAT